MAGFTSFCLRCRTLLADGAGCDEHGPDPVVSLGSKHGILSAKRAAWRPVPLSEERVVQLGVGTALVGAVGATFGMLAFGAVALIAGILMTVFLIVAFAAAGHAELLSVRRSPHGASSPCPSGTPLVGRIVDGGEPRVVASGVELRLRERGSGVTLQSAHSDGFEIVLDDGRRVEIPARRVRIESPDGGRPSDGRGVLVELGLSALDDCFPHDEARRVTLEKGDRVELFAELAPDAADYRTELRFVPNGVPWLRKA